MSIMKIYLFAGTNEGRTLISHFENAQIQTVASLASEYAKDFLSNYQYVQIHVGRMDEKQMYQSISQSGATHVIDATHPYAVEVTATIKKVARSLNLPYLRVLRESNNNSLTENFPDLESLIQFLNATDGNILLTTGSKNLAEFTEVRNYADRIFVRCLPMEGNIKKATELGYKQKNLLLMQGPFSEEMNYILLKEYHITYLVTKDSGENGGFREKIQAAKRAHSKCLVLSRPTQESGYSLEEILQILNIKKTSERKNLFPIFIKTEDKKFLIVGAGNIALRRVKTLLHFTKDITIISKTIHKDLLEIVHREKLNFKQRAYKEADAKGFDFILATTNSPKTNEQIKNDAEKFSVLCNCADNKEKSDFYFPAIAETENLSVAITGTGNNHHYVKTASEKIRNFLREENL